MTMRKLVLVRHSQSLVRPDLPPDQWSLTAEGRRRCQSLATALAPITPAVVVTSHERKAISTGRLLAAAMQTPWTRGRWLHEQERSGVPFQTQERFLASIRMLLENPTRVVLGQETGREALHRFARGIGRVLRRFPQGNIVIVTHGTVLTLFVAARTAWEPWEFWQRLQQPAFVLFELPSLTLAEAVFTV